MGNETSKAQEIKHRNVDNEIVTFGYIRKYFENKYNLLIPQLLIRLISKYCLICENVKFYI